MKFFLALTAVCVLVQQGAQPLSSHTEQGHWSPHNPYPPWHSLRALWDVPIVVIPSKPYGFPQKMQSYRVSLHLNQGNASKLQPAFMGNGCVVHPLLLASGRFFRGHNPTWAPGMCYWITANSFLCSPQSRSSLSSHLTLKFRYYRFLFLLPDWSLKKGKTGKSIKKITTWRLCLQQSLKMSWIIKTRMVKTYLCSTKSIVENAKWRLQILSCFFLGPYTSPQCFPQMRNTTVLPWKILLCPPKACVI